MCINLLIRLSIIPTPVVIMSVFRALFETCVTFCNRNKREERACGLLRCVCSGLGFGGGCSCINTDINRSACRPYMASLWVPPPRVLHPREASSLTRGTGPVSEQSFLHSHPPCLLPTTLNRKHTYLCRGHLPVQACPLCGCLYKPGILLPCSPGRADTAVGSRATGRLHAWTGWHAA